MPKTYVAQKINNLNGVSFSVDGEGKITGITAVCEVGYGDMEQMDTIDILSMLNEGEKQQAQRFYNGVMAKITQAILE